MPPTYAAPPTPRWAHPCALTADVRGPPGHAHAHLVAGLGVGGHGRAEALAVAPRVAGARVAHAGLVVLGGVDLRSGGEGPFSQESQQAPGPLDSRLRLKPHTCDLR